jgi:hypothetical protein
MMSGFIFDIEASMHSIVLSDIMARTDEHTPFLSGIHSRTTVTRRKVADCSDS